MFSLAMAFLTATILTGLLGLAGDLPVTSDVAQALFFFFLISFVVSLVVHISNVRVPRE